MLGGTNCRTISLFVRFSCRLKYLSWTYIVFLILFSGLLILLSLIFHWFVWPVVMVQYRTALKRNRKKNQTVDCLTAFFFFLLPTASKSKLSVILLNEWERAHRKTKMSYYWSAQSQKCDLFHVNSVKTGL